MKILFSAENFYPPLGGAEISMYFLLRELGIENEVYVVSAGNKEKEFKVDTVKVFQRKNVFVPFTRARWVHLLISCKHWEKVLSEVIKRIRPDVILTQRNFAIPTIKVAKRYNILSILFIRDLGLICPVSFSNKDASLCDDFCWRCIPHRSKLQYVFIKIILKKFKETLKNASVIVANSRYVADIIHDRYHLDCEIIYPFIKLGEYKTEKRTPKYVTFINPAIHKGAKIVLEIAKRMRTTEFLIVGRRGISFGRLPNVTSISWVSDMKTVYSKTKILLIPSLEAESFGRVAVEAMVNGIPCIVSGRGALPEVVADAGIVIKDPLDIDAWIDSINRLKSDKALYQKMCEKSKKQAEKFCFERQYEKFRNILERISS